MDLNHYLQSARGRGARMADELEISRAYLSQMATGKSPISPERCVAIERASGGLVTRKELRPHDWRRIWPELDQQAPDPAAAADGDAEPQCEQAAGARIGAG